MWDDLIHNPIGGDDYVYISRSINLERLMSSLWSPHNCACRAIVSSLDILLIQVAGTLESLPTVLTLGSYVPLVLAMLAGGHLIVRESGSLTSGLIAIALMALIRCLSRSSPGIR